MEICYRITKLDNSILTIMGKEGWILSCINNDMMYFYKNAPQTRKTPVKQEEELRYNKNIVGGLCSYAFDSDFEELYKEWREERKLSTSYKTIYNEASEKRTFNKLNGKPKKIALEMLNNAIASKWLILYDLQEKEKEKIIVQLKDEQKKEEAETEGFNTKQELEEAKIISAKIDKYLAEHREIYEQARILIEESNPSLEGQFKTSMINAKARIIARENIES